MAFPYDLVENFEAGTYSAAWDSETDGDSKLDYPHWSQLALLPGMELPYLGAYCMRIDLAGGVGEASLTAVTGFDVLASTAAAVRFYVYVGTDLVMANTDTFDLLRWESAGPVNEFGINLYYTTAAGLALRGGDSGAGTFRSTPLSQGVWHCVELVINTGAGADGTADFYVDGLQIGAQLTAIAAAELTQARLGAIGIDAGTTAGTLLFDQVVVDSTRLGPIPRFPQTHLLVQSGHACLGPGVVEEYYLLDGGAGDCSIALYDTDRANTAGLPFTPPLLVSGANRLEEPTSSMAQFTRGCYVALEGTDPRAWVTFRFAPRSLANLRQAALLRRRGRV